MEEITSKELKNMTLKELQEKEIKNFNNKISAVDDTTTDNSISL